MTSHPTAAVDAHGLPAHSVLDEHAEVARLLRRVTRGDAQALGGLYDATARRVLGLVSRVLGPGAVAQEVAVRVYESLWLGEERPPRGASLPWVLELAHRRAVGRLRAQVPRQRTGDDAGSARVVRAFPPDKAWLPGLAEDERAALSEVYLRGRTTAQADQRLGWAPGTSVGVLHESMLHLARLYAQPRRTDDLVRT